MWATVPGFDFLFPSFPCIGQAAAQPGLELVTSAFLTGWVAERVNCAGARRVVRTSVVAGVGNGYQRLRSRGILYGLVRPGLGSTGRDAHRGGSGGGVCVCARSLGACGARAC